MSYPSASNVPTIEVIGANVRIRWQVPYSGGLGIPIIGYEILIKDKNGNMVEDTVNCDGQNTQSIIDNTECFIPMTTLNDPAKYGLS